MFTAREMAGMKLSSMGLNDSIAHVFRARSILTAKEALFKTELELVELLDVPFEEVQSALAIISAKVFDILSERAKNEPTFGHLPTGLPALDESLWGGIPFGVMTEIVGPAVLAAMPEELGGLDGSVIYVDTEKKFGQEDYYRFPSPDFRNTLTATSEYGRDNIIQRQEILGRQASILKRLAEAHRMPVIVPNQVRCQDGPGGQETAYTTAGYVSNTNVKPI